MSEGDVRRIFSLQMDNAAKSEALKATISRNRNGSVIEIDNGANPPNAKRALFEILSNVDVFGELRTKIVLGALGISEMDAESGYAELKKKHEEPHRFYHTWEHVVELLDHLFDAASETGLTNEEIGVVGTAALFHDSVYEIDRTYYRDNEIHSANYAKKWLMNHHVNHKRVEEIYSLVRETAHTKHITELEIPRGMPERYGFLFGLLHDIDMAILGSSPERYSLYVSDIVREFGIYPGREFVKGRLELLDKWIADDDLFVTAYGKSRFLPQARENVAAEVARLRTMAQGKQ